ncbi:hypothetical protein DXG01_012304, partial [Tephrocybe rancida]
LLLSPAQHLKTEKAENMRVISAPPSLYIPVLLALAAVAYSPFTSVADGTFLPNFILPELNLRTLTLIVSITSVILHIRSSYLALYSISSDGVDILSSQTWITFLESAWSTLHVHHPAQSSIGWDVVWTSTSFVVWILLGGLVPNSAGLHKLPVPLTATSLLSVGGAAPWAFESSRGLQAKEE